MQLTEEFMNNCIQNKISSIKDICKAAQDEVNLLQSEVDILEDQKNIKEKKIKELSLLIKQMSSTSQSEYNIVNVKFNNLNKYLQKMIIEIIDFLEKKSSVSSKQLIDEFGIKEQKVIYSSIKWLWDSNIIERDENSLFIRGKEWDTRPKMLEEVN